MFCRQASEWRTLILQLFVPSQTFYQTIRSLGLDPEARHANDINNMKIKAKTERERHSTQICIFRSQT